MNHCACTKEYTIKKISNSFKHNPPLGENGKIEQGTNMLQHKLVENKFIINLCMRTHISSNIKLHTVPA